ncbi:MAG TPA: hypothetical protein VIC26_03575 [Marinagarivorans sp.]
MKWLVIKLVMLLVVGVGILNYALYLKTGQSPLADIDWSLPSFSVPDVASLKQAMPDIEMPSFARDGGESGPIAVYKWVGDDGVINYSQSHPGDAVAAEVMIVDPEANVVQADKLPEPEPEVQPAAPKAQPSPALPSMSLAPTPDRVKKLMDDAKGIQAKMDERAKTLEDMLDSATR